MSTTVPPCLPHPVLRHWFEPWRVAHASWLCPPAAPPGWADRVAGSSVAARLMRRPWMAHAGIGDCLPPDDGRLQWRDMPAGALVDATRLLGLMVASNWPGFMARWAVDAGGGTVMPGGAAMARRVAAMGRVRRLPCPPMCAGATTAAQPDRVGAAYLRALLETAPGAWARVRLGLPWDMARPLDGAGAGMAAAWLAPEARRYTTLAWNRICDWLAGAGPRQEQQE